VLWRSPAAQANGMGDATPPCCVTSRSELGRQENCTIRAAVVHVLCELLCQSALLCSAPSLAISAVACLGASSLILVKSTQFARPASSLWKNNFQLYGDVCRVCMALRFADIVLQSVMLEDIPHFSPWATTTEVGTGSIIIDIIMMPVYAACYHQVPWSLLV